MTREPLVERESELERLGAVLEDAGAGHGGAVLVEGEPGIGKTSLLAHVAAAAGERGFTVLRARASELEREFAFAVFRQAFGPLLRVPEARVELLGDAARLAAVPLGLNRGELSEGAALHGLYWLAANVADRGPVLLAIDDLHWADEPSRRALAYLAARVAEHPLMICATSRPAFAPPDWDAVLRPAPLSADGVARVVRAALPADAELCAACLRATGGNPFLLREAISELRTGDAPTADRVARLRPAGLRRVVSARLARAGPEAAAVANAICVLGPDAALARVARLAELELEATVDAVERLRAEGILAGGTRFGGAGPAPPRIDAAIVGGVGEPSSGAVLEPAHPLIGAAIVGALGEPAGGLAQLRAATLLRDDGLPAARIASHLLVAEPSGAAWVVGTLRASARDALAGGAPDIAVALLERARAEPPAALERAAVLVELGGALARAGRPEAASAALTHALALTGDPHTRAEIALELVGPIYSGAFVPDALSALRRARRDLGDDAPELAVQLETAITLARQIVGDPAAAWIKPLERALTAVDDPALAASGLATIAYAAAGTGAAPAEEVIERALAAARASPDADPNTMHMIAAALPIAGRPSAALPLLDGAIERAGRLGDPATFSLLSLLRARNHIVAGALTAAEADARAALAAYPRPAGSVPFAVGVLVLALTEYGDHDAAEHELATHGLEATRELPLFQDFVLLQARGQLRLAVGRPAEALEDLSAVGERMTRVGFTNPSFADWRSQAAAAHLTLGDRTQARSLAEEELRLALRFGAPREIGIALRTRALTERGPRRVATLTEAVAVLAPSEARLELARALVDQGAALRGLGRRTDARGPLRRGLDLAAHGGARRLAERARDELRAVGARPRRERLSGLDALTASELRVARLAADGRNNREIAQALFVTRRTVEAHLTSAYRKLDIATRDELPQALLT